MTHLKAAFTILVLLILMSISSALLVRKECTGLLDILAEIKSASDSGEREKAQKLCDTALESWNKSEKILLCTVSLDKITAAEQTIYRLGPLLSADCDEFEAELAAAELMIRNISDGEIPYLTNIL